MNLATKLIGFLNRVFDRDPRPFLALIVDYQGGGMTWQVSDRVLTIVATGGVAPATLTVDLTQYTLAQLAAYLAARPGFNLPYLDPDRANLSALVLLDGAGDQSTSNGDHLYGYTSLLWAFMDAYASELFDAEGQVAALPDQMNTVTGSGYWLDEIGSYYNVPRQTGELDALYGPRIIAEVLRPRGNNVAIELAIAAYSGQLATVTDVITFGPITPLHNAAITHNSAHTHNATTPPLYGLFDVICAYDLINGGDVASLMSQISAIVEKVRDAGTHMRGLALSGPSTISDSLTPPDDASQTVTAKPSLADTLTSPSEAAALALSDLMADALTQPSDTEFASVYGNWTTDTAATLTDQSANALQFVIEFQT